MNEKKVGELKVGDEVLAENGTVRITGIEPIGFIQSASGKSVRLLTDDGGDVICSTADSVRTP